MIVSWMVTHIVMLVGLLLGLVLTSYILLQRRSASGTLAWLLVILPFPYIGVPLYLMFGGRKMHQRASEKNMLGLAPPTPSKDRVEVHPTDRLLQTYNMLPAQGGHAVTLCTTGEAIYRHFVDLIESAQKSIWISTFVYAKDEVGRDILDRLAARAAQGIQVRLLLDGVGSLHTHRSFFRPLTQAGGQVSYFMPVLHRPFRGRTNLRNHRKSLLVDGRTVLAGGANIAAEYMGPGPAPGRWRDLSFVLRGPAVAHYGRLFASDWEFASGRPLEPEGEAGAGDRNGAGSDLVQVVPSGPDVPTDALYDSLLSSMYAAQKRLWIVTPYFVPDESLVQALILACRRGVDVRILLPGRSNHRLADIVRGEYLREIQRAGGGVYFYRDAMVHAKALLVDRSLAMIGSANMDIRSLYLNYEIAMYIYSSNTIGRTEAWIEGLLQSSQKGIAPAPLARRLFEGTVRVLTPLL